MPSRSSSMLTTTDTVYGWSPSGGDDEDVNITQDMFFRSLKPFPTRSSTTFLSPVCPPLDVPLPKPCATTSQSTPLVPLSRQAISHSSVAPSSNRRAQRNRNRDPSWIPRPRNAFIIFRCEYSREHSQGSQDSQNEDEPENPTVKTLSKRAAEAWKNLDASERERYKQMADQERDDHARLYPHYRFRPMKRQPSGTRKTSSASDISRSTRVPSTERPAAPSTHVPSVVASAPEKPRVSPSRERAEVPVSVPPVIPAPLSDPLLYSIDVPENPQLPLQFDYDPLPFCPSLEATTTLLSDISPSSSLDLYSPLCNLPSDPFSCHDTTFGSESTKEDLERAQALEAYAIGLHNFDLFSPFIFPEFS